jgi:hypothetical protein
MNKSASRQNPIAAQGFLDKAAQYGMTREQALEFLKSAIDMPQMQGGGNSYGNFPAGMPPKEYNARLSGMAQSILPKPAVQGAQAVGNWAGQNAPQIGQGLKAVGQLNPLVMQGKGLAGAGNMAAKGIQAGIKGIQNAGGWLGNKFGSQGFVDKAAEYGIDEYSANLLLSKLAVGEQSPELSFDRGMHLGTEAGYPIGHKLAIPIVKVMQALREAKSREEMKAQLLPLLKTLGGVGVGGVGGGALAVGNRLADELAARNVPAPATAAQ